MKYHRPQWIVIATHTRR